MNSTLIILGQRIKKARLDMKLSQAELAERLSVSVPHVSDIERGRTNCSVAIFASIAETLNVSADWLLSIDTPHSKMYRLEEIEELLADCDPDEIEAIIKTAKVLKNALISMRKET